MKYLFLICLLCLFSACGQPEQSIGGSDMTKQAKEFVDLLAREEYARVEERFDTKMQEALPEGKVEEMWTALQGRFGQFQRQVGVRQSKENGFDCVYVTCSFDKKDIDIKVVYDKEQKVAGLWFQ